MILSDKQIRTCVRGAVEIQEENGFYSLFRFTTEQKTDFENKRQFFYDRTYASAGIRLHFTTDSRTLRFAYKLSRLTTEATHAFDLYENGTLTHHEVLTADEQTREIAWTLGEGEKELILYFPWAVYTQISAPVLDDGATFAPVSCGKTVFLFGDSITQGFCATYPSGTYAMRLSRALGVHIINKGIGSERFRPEVLGHKDTVCPDAIVIAYGTNDWNSCSYETVQHDAGAFFARLKELYAGVPTVVITPIARMDSDTEKPYGRPFSAIHDDITALCADNPDVRVLRGEPLMPHEATCFAPDGLHPNDEGFARYADHLVPVLKALL